MVTVWRLRYLGHEHQFTSKISPQGAKQLTFDQIRAAWSSAGLMPPKIADITLRLQPELWAKLETEPSLRQGAARQLEMPLVTINWHGMSATALGRCQAAGHPEHRVGEQDDLPCSAKLRAGWRRVNLGSPKQFGYHSGMKAGHPGDLQDRKGPALDRRGSGWRAGQKQGYSFYPQVIMQLCP